MSIKKDSAEAIKALHAIVIEMNLTSRRCVKNHIITLQKHLKDTTDINEFIEPQAIMAVDDKRGKHWAKRRAAQQYLYTDEQNTEKTISHDELAALTMRSEKQLQMAFYKGNGSIMINVKHPSSYGSMVATITKL